MNIVINSNLLIALVNNDPRSEIVHQQFDNWISQEVKIYTPNVAIKFLSQFNFLNPQLTSELPQLILHILPP